MSITIMM